MLNNIDYVYRITKICKSQMFFQRREHPRTTKVPWMTHSLIVFPTITKCLQPQSAMRHHTWELPRSSLFWMGIGYFY